MPFTSLEYLIFLPLLFLVHHLSRGRMRWGGLLAASYGFYLDAGASYLVVVLAFVTLLSYVCGLQVGPAGNRPRFFLLIGIVGNIAVLVGMKYLPFLWECVSSLPSFIPVAKLSAPPLLVSVGVSFFVFQAIGYLVAVYLENEDPERHLGIFALTLAFFPKLLQGPIEKSSDLAVQFRQSYRFDYLDIRSGMTLFLWGAFKKVVIADRLALFVDAVYARPTAYAGISLVFATVLYAFQLYLDFSGYTDMALGSARLFNIRLSQNFDRPYLATSVGDFWRRWHMTFSRWILANLFQPLQMRWRYWGKWGTALALMVTFLVSGIWHGAAWGFIAWGGIHGIYLSCSVIWSPYRRRLYRWLGIEKAWWLRLWQVCVTFLLVSFAWIFFRAGTLEKGWYIATHLFTPGPLPAANWGELVETYLLAGQSIWDFYLAAVLLAALGGISFFCARRGWSSLPDAIEAAPGWVRWGTCYAITLCLVFAGIFGNATFIYFQF
ncbi:MBOAT family O-acyltransferase [Geomesophilobacter sediminis]|uniref:MBOAT family protein n=1 Tax=Geomesophilobacter sediminis TaxID=2798584 RepID=A0A8J7IM48_9BACT|nr:MBOAT family O-acyltransferase [Geomesophilobacter sediminis]MBJ6723693.1 MBOAT family protein [Geomesophilobacter sediminis]